MLQSDANIGDIIARYADEDFIEIEYIAKLNTLIFGTVIVEFMIGYEEGTSVYPSWQFCKKLTIEEILFYKIQNGIEI